MILPWSMGKLAPKNGIEKTLIWQDLSGLNFLSIYNNMVFSHAFADGLPVSWSYV